MHCAKNWNHCRTAEATCSFRVECWRKNTANSTPLSSVFHVWILRTSLASQYLYSPYRQFLKTLCGLSLDACDQRQQTFCHPSVCPTSWALSTRSNSFPGIPQTNESKIFEFCLISTCHHSKFRGGKILNFFRICSTNFSDFTITTANLCTNLLQKIFVY